MRGAMDELDAGAVREGEAAGSPPTRGRFAFVIPLFDHGRTVREVVEQARSLGFPVFVVDDGSTDGGAGSLEGLDGVTVLRHPINRGKGAALCTGFAAAADVADWAITVDADGQHDPRQATELIAAIRDGERPLVVGRREGMDLPDIPWKSRFGRKFSNFWVRASGGHAVLDTQTGFRIYPLPETLELGARSNRFQFEVEVLVLARRHGIPAVEVPVRVTYSPPGGRVTHYRPWIDFWRNSAVFGRFITVRVLGLGRHAAVRWWLLALTVPALGGAALLAPERLHIETDIAAKFRATTPFSPPRARSSPITRRSTASRWISPSPTVVPIRKGWRRRGSGWPSGCVAAAFSLASGWPTSARHWPGLPPTSSTVCRRCSRLKSCRGTWRRDWRPGDRRRCEFASSELAQLDGVGRPMGWGRTGSRCVSSSSRAWARCSRPATRTSTADSCCRGTTATCCCWSILRGGRRTRRPRRACGTCSHRCNASSPRMQAGAPKACGWPQWAASGPPWTTSARSAPTRSKRCGSRRSA